MPHFDPRAANPERYEATKKEQTKLLNALKGAAAAVRLCPYCDKKISVTYPGYHGPEITKCPNCGEIIVFPALKLSRSVSKVSEGI